MKNSVRKMAIAAVLAIGSVSAFAETDPTATLTTLITTDWGLVVAAGITVMTGVIAFAILKKFRKVT